MPSRNTEKMIQSLRSCLDLPLTLFLMRNLWMDSCNIFLLKWKFKSIQRRYLPMRIISKSRKHWLVSKIFKLNATSLIHNTLLCLLPVIKTYNLSVGKVSQFFNISIANELIGLEKIASNEYTQSVRKKFLLLFSMFAVSSK